MWLPTGLLKKKIVKLKRKQQQQHNQKYVGLIITNSQIKGVTFIALTLITLSYIFGY